MFLWWTRPTDAEYILTIQEGYHLLCVVLCDGETIDKECLTQREGLSVGHKFPLQRPSQLDHALRVAVIKRISSECLSLPTSLGGYVSCPHKLFKWTTMEDGSIVHLEVTLEDATRYLA